MSNLAVAVSLAERGWVIAPTVITRTANGKKLPSFPFGGWKSARSSDPDVVRDWWAQRPDASPAILTKDSGLLVIDLDVVAEQNGYETWAKLCAEHCNGQPPETFTVLTASGGTHYYFSNDDERLKNGCRNLGPGIDVRGAGDRAGGLVFGPGSSVVGEDGAWEILHDVPVLPLPDWLKTLLLPEESAVPDSPESLLDLDVTARAWTLEQAEREYARIDKVVLDSGGTAFNTHINNAAFRYGHFVAGGFLSFEQAYARLNALSVALWNGDLSDGNDVTARNGLRDGGKEPYTLREVAEAELLFTDSGVAEYAVVHVLFGEYTYAHGLGWLRYDGVRWARVDAGVPREAVRAHATERVVSLARAGRTGTAEFKGWSRYTNTSKLTSVTELCASMPGVRQEASAYDADPDVLNTPLGVVDLATGDVRPHEPEFLLTKVTSGSYVPGYTHADWETALTALEPAERVWLQNRIGQAITGWPTDDGVIPLLHGPNGQNGKGALMTGGCLPALKDYAAPCSTKLFEGASSHSTEMADLRGNRLMMAEELADGAVLNVDAVKRVTDVEYIKARYVRQDNITFEATHSLFLSSNYRPRVKATDGGSWRRLCLVVFPFEFVKPGEPLVAPYQRRGDLGLKPRIKAGKAGQHDAVVTWAVEGARRWYAWRTESERASAAGDELPESPCALTARVRADTLSWRSENDLVLAFWDQCLRADQGAMVSAADLLVVFNRWLAANGHTGAYSRERFAKDFGTHQETRVNRVRADRVRGVAGVTRRPVEKRAQSETSWLGEQKRYEREADHLEPLPERPHVWVGISYQ